MRLLKLVLAVLVLASGAARAEDDWAAVLEKARGQTVYFNAWGGSDRINRYIEWAGEQVAERYGVTVEHVKLADTAEVVARLLVEKTAARDEGGSVDVVWINGENFAAMKENGLLGAAFVDALPSFAGVDTEGRPTTLVDFGVTTDGLEAPWGMAQLVFLHDSARLQGPPRSIPALLDWAEANPGRFAYPQPPDFLGTTFLKQAALELSADPAAFQDPVEDADFAAVTQPLWDYLDQLHPLLWRQGETFPTSGPQLLTLLNDGEIDLAFTFNPGEADAAIAEGQLPDSVRGYVLDQGTLGNTHFLAIPWNAEAREGALVLIDFLLSPEAQLRKQDAEIWGDPTVLGMDRLTEEQRAAFAALPHGPATPSPEELGRTLPEPDPSWVGALEAEWQARYLQ